MKPNEMNQKYTIDEIRQLEEACRVMRSEAIFDTFAALFKGLWSKISSPAPASRNSRGQIVERPLGASAR